MPHSLLEQRKERKTAVLVDGGRRIPKYVNEFWPSTQRQACVIHEISYRACFKPQVPHFFIQRFSKKGDSVYDPFMGRGTTLIEALLAGRRALGNDINPLSVILAGPRLDIPEIQEVEDRLKRIRIVSPARADIDVSMFYHRKTEAEIISLKRYLDHRRRDGVEDKVDKWIRMVATNRLTGHSPGFFSVYTLPPNQAAGPDDQRRINKKRKQRPVYRDVRALILRKSERLLKRLSKEETVPLSGSQERVMLMTEDARSTPLIEDNSVQLTVTSPPFLDVVDYAGDNWLRCWFNGIDEESVSRSVTRARTLDEWKQVMLDVFSELFRITKNGGYVAYEVGEIRKGTIRLDEVVLPLGAAAGFQAQAVYINRQKFTKTSNIWGIQNNLAGTNTNRIVLFQKK